MTFKPLFDKILVKAISSEETIGGLLIPETANNLKKAEVVAVGDGNAVGVGQTVLYSKDDATPINLEGGQYLLLREGNVWMVNSDK